MIGYDEKSNKRLKQENDRMAGQLQEAISIVKNGSDYEKMHLLSILRDGVPKCHLCNDTGYNSVSGDHAMLGDFCSCQKGAERHMSYEASWEPWDVIVRKSSEMGMPSWVCAPIRLQIDGAEIDERPVEEHIGPWNAASERKARICATTMERELNWDGQGCIYLHLTKDELAETIKFLTEHSVPGNDSVELLLTQLERADPDPWPENPR